MSEEQQKKPANITREELYLQVWATPMSQLGTQYGISGNGLKKICVRLNVPYPPRGYWAKLGAGKAVRQTPLPKPLAGIPVQVVITPTSLPAAAGCAPELDPDTAERLREASAKTSGITVPATLRRPHRAIADWITRHKREMADARRDRSRFGFALQPKPFSSLERRRQRLLSTLLKEAEKLGYKVRGEAPRNLSLEIGRNGVEFTLYERIKQVRRPLTDQEKARYSSTRKWQQEKIATGELVFTLKTYLGPGLPARGADRLHPSGADDCRPHPGATATGSRGDPAPPLGGGEKVPRGTRETGSGPQSVAAVRPICQAMERRSASGVLSRRAQEAVR